MSKKRNRQAALLWPQGSSQRSVHRQLLPAGRFLRALIGNHFIRPEHCYRFVQKIMTDEQAIQAKIEKMGAMFQDPTRALFDDLFMEDCDYITFNGQHLKGIEENFDAHLQLSRLKIFRGATLETGPIQIKFRGPGTAVVIATGGIKFRWQKKLPASRLSINTTVFIRQPNGDWKIASFQNSRIRRTGFLQRLLAK